MKNNHLTYFKVENFKKFESLEVNNIGQINLIVGNNNVGKTCLLEALTINERFKTTISYFSQLLIKRNLKSFTFLPYNGLNTEFNFKKNEIALYQKDLTKKIFFKVDDIEIEIENVNEKIKNSENKQIQEFIEDVKLFDYPEIFPNSNNWIVFKINKQVKFLADLTSEYYSDFLIDKKTVPAVMLSEKVEDYLNETYSLIYGELNLGEKVSEVLNRIFPDVKVVDLRSFDSVSPFNSNELYIKTLNKQVYHSIREYGEGFIRCLHFIFLILSNQSNRICIDEIDTGIHYSKLKSNWSIIVSLCKELNVQLFATTHSKECLESLIEASEEDVSLQESIRLIKLNQVENSDKIKAITYPYNEFEYLVESNSETR